MSFEDKCNNFIIIMLTGHLLGLLFFSLLSMADMSGPWNFMGASGVAGNMTIFSNSTSGLFYWFFQRLNGNVTTDTWPLIIWLQGGPGCSSGVGMMGEGISPIKVDSSGQAYYNNLTWSMRVHILTVDFPFGVGYSSPTDWHDWIQGSGQASIVLYTFLQKLIIQYPAWFKRDIYIWGHDYVGHFAPSLAAYILTQNQGLSPSNSSYINLKGLALGDPWIDLTYQVTSFDSISYNLGLANREQRIQMSVLENYVLGNISSNATLALQSLYDINEYIENITGKVNYCNTRDYSFYNFGNLSSFFNNATVASMFYASGIQWQECNEAITLNFTNDLFISWTSALSQVVSSIKVLVYTSQDDLWFNPNGVQSVLRSMNWSQIINFLAARRGNWYVAGNIAGYAMSYSNLTYVQILKAGLFATIDQPLASRDMAYRFIFNQGWN